MRTTLLATLLLLPTLAAAEIYRHVDAQGRVSYSDQAPAGASQVTLEPVNTLPGDRSRAVAPADRPAPAGSLPTPAFSGYESLTITGVENGAVLRNPEAPLTVSARPVPGLQPGHSLVIRHNGAAANSDGASSATISNLERGAHAFTAEIIDKSGNVLIRSHPATLQVHRHSAAQRGNSR